MFSLAPDREQMNLLWSALKIGREIYNVALWERRMGEGVDSLSLARKFTCMRRSEPRLQILPYRSVEAILRQIDTYTMNKHCLPKAAKAAEWNEIPYKDGVKPMDGSVWIPKIGEIEAPEIEYASPFKMAWVVWDAGRWKLRTKART